MGLQTAKRLRIFAPAPTPMPMNARILKQQHANMALPNSTKVEDNNSMQ